MALCMRCGLLLLERLCAASLRARVCGDYWRTDWLSDSASDGLSYTEPDSIPDTEPDGLPYACPYSLSHAQPHQLPHRPSLR